MSSLTLNPVLKVSRPVSACPRCRGAKVKCDGKLPACTACEKAGRANECSNAADQFARGKERSYVSALELRIEKLEKRIAFARLRKHSASLHESDAPPSHLDRKDSLAFIRAAIHRKEARNRENSDVNSLISDFGYLSVNAATDFDQNTTNMTFARLVLAAATNEPVPQLQPGTIRFPPQDKAFYLLHYYVEHIYPLLPSFEATSLWTIHDSLYHEEQLAIKDSDYYLFYMVLAIAAIAQSQTHGDAPYQDAVVFVSNALSFADRALTPGYTTQVQSLLLLTQYALYDPSHFDSWNLSGVTYRAAIDLGFHQDPPRGSDVDKGLVDLRRRLFYCVYTMDRAISMIHVRPLSFRDDAIRVSMPSVVQHSPAFVTPSMSAKPRKAPTPPDLSRHLFELRVLQSRWYQQLCHPPSPSPFSDGLAEPQASSDFTGSPSAAASSSPSLQVLWSMYYDFQTWHRSVPTNLAKPFRDIFDLALQYSCIYFLSPSLRQPTMTEHRRNLLYEHTSYYLEKWYQVYFAPSGSGHGTDNGDPRGLSDRPTHSFQEVLSLYYITTQYLDLLRNWEALDYQTEDGPGTDPRVKADPEADPCPPSVVSFASSVLSKPPGSQNPRAAPPLITQAVLPPPPLPIHLASRPQETQEERTMHVLALVDEMLLAYTQRWPVAENLLATFRAAKRSVLA